MKSVFRTAILFLCAWTVFAQKPYTDLIPPNVAWFTSEADWIGKTGVGAPKNPSTPTQMWRDNAFIYGSWWTFNTNGSTAYRVLDGLCPIDSPKFLATFNDMAFSSVISTYREYAFLFPDGVPCLTTITVPNAQASTLNFGGTSPATPYPIVLRTDSLLLPPGPDGKVTYITIQDFLTKNKPKLTTWDSMIQVVKGILASGKSAQDMVQMIRLAVQSTPVPDPLI